MRKMKFKFPVQVLALTLLVISLLVPTVGAQAAPSLLASAQGTAWGIGTPDETAHINLKVTNLYLDASKNNIIKDWVLQFDFDGDIQSVTNAVITGKQGSQYTLKGTTSKDIAYGETLDLKIVTTLNGQSSAVFNNITLRPEVIAASWKLLGVYKVGDIVEHNGVYYKNVQAHTAYAPNWTPDQTPALWGPTSIESYTYSTSTVVDLTIIESWVLLGTYTTGQIVQYNGQFYKCVQGHTAYAANWYPGPDSQALWKAVTLDF